MNRIFSTTNLHVRDRFDYWHSVTCRELVEHTGSPGSRLHFSAEIDAAAFSDIGIFQFQHTPMRFSHDEAHITVAKSDELFLFCQLEESTLLEQADRDIKLERGDITVIDPMLPYRGGFPNGTKVLVLTIPRRELEARLGRVRDWVAHAIHPETGVSRLASTFLSMLPHQVASFAPACADAIRTQLLDLVSLAFGSDLDAIRPVNSSKGFVVERIRAAIDRRITDPELTAKDVALAAGVSLRHANAVLAQQSTSVSRLILAARLNRCRRALADPAQKHRNLGEIAYGWGFSDMTHFGRAFRRAYGVLPSQYRTKE